MLGNMVTVQDESHNHPQGALTPSAQSPLHRVCNLAPSWSCNWHDFRLLPQSA